MVSTMENIEKNTYYTPQWLKPLAMFVIKIWCYLKFIETTDLKYIQI